MKDVLPMTEGVDSFIGQLVVTAVRNGGARTIKENDDVFYESVMANPHLRHFFLGLLHYLIAASRAWDVQALNLDPLPGRDDWTDLSLLLYIRDKRDRVVSVDGQIISRAHAVAPGVRVSSAAEI